MSRPAPWEPTSAPSRNSPVAKFSTGIVRPSTPLMAKRARVTACGFARTLAIWSTAARNVSRVTYSINRWPITAAGVNPVRRSTVSLTKVEPPIDVHLPHHVG